MAPIIPDRADCRKLQGVHPACPEPQPDGHVLATSDGLPDEDHDLDLITLDDPNNVPPEEEDPAILWALKNEKFRIVDILMPLNKINLLGVLNFLGSNLGLWPGLGLFQILAFTFHLLKENIYNYGTFHRT